MSNPLQNAVAAWNNDRTSNTVELVSQAAGLLMQFCDEWNAGDDERFKTELATFCLSLIKMRPGAAALWNLANDALHAADNPQPIPGPNGPRLLTPVQAASNAALRFLAFLGHHERRIANEMLPYIHSGSLFLTHSYSLTVLAALVRAKEAGKRFGVVCTQSLPRQGGILMARALAGAGIEVEVIADAAAAEFIQGFYHVLLGADAIVADGLVNRVGTLGMALVAKAVGVPVYCLAGSEKFLPLETPVSMDEHDPEEIIASAPNLHGYNCYLDLTPLDCITRFFTEDGPIDAQQAYDKLAKNRLHPLLR